MRRWWGGMVAARGRARRARMPAGRLQLPHLRGAPQHFLAGDPPRLFSGGAGVATAGFTLIELLVSLTITGLIVGATYMAAQVAFPAMERNREIQQTNRRARNARLVLGSLLRSARVDLRNVPQGVRGLEADAAPSLGDEFLFVSSLGFPFAGFPEQELVDARLWLDRGMGTAPERSSPGPRSAAGGTVTLDLRSLNRGDERFESIPLFHGVDAMEISYLDIGSTEWRDGWDRPALLPVAVRVAFDGPRPPPPLLVNLPMGGRSPVPGMDHPREE